MIIPPIIKKGDWIAIISSARKISKEELAPSIKILEQWDVEVVCGPNLFASADQMAGTITQRTEDLQWAINESKVKAVLFARGGYGTVQIVDKVDYKPLITNPKWFCGFSDVTVLHNHLNTLGLQSIHSTMPILFDKTSQTSIASLYNILKGNAISYELKPNVNNKTGKGVGQLVGGNLSLLVSMIGTPSDLQTDSKILFVEDIDEYKYHVERMLFQLDRAGKLKNLQGLIIGQMTDLKDNQIPFGKTVEEMVLTITQDYNFPILFNFPSGHTFDNFALKLGQIHQLVIEEQQIQLFEL